MLSQVRFLWVLATGPIFSIHHKLPYFYIERRGGAGSPDRRISSDNSLKGQCHEIVWFWFFSWISSPPPPQSMTFRPFRIFSKFAKIFESQGAPPVSTTPVANLPPVSATPAANFYTIFASVVDTGGKFATGAIDTGGKFATSINDARWQIATGIRLQTP